TPASSQYPLLEEHIPTVSLIATVDVDADTPVRVSTLWGDGSSTVTLATAPNVSAELTAGLPSVFGPVAVRAGPAPMFASQSAMDALPSFEAQLYALFDALVTLDASGLVMFACDIRDVVGCPSAAATASNLTRNTLRPDIRIVNLDVTISLEQQVPEPNI